MSGSSREPRKRKRSNMFCEHCQEFVSKSAYYRHKEEFTESINRQSSPCPRRGKLSGTVPEATVRNKSDYYDDFDVGNAKDDSVDLQSSDVRDVTLLSMKGMVH